MSPVRRRELRELSREGFFHAYNGYMEHAFPFDELKPLSCIGRGRDREDPDNYSLNDVLGDYLLTLVDALDTLAVLGDRDAFARAVEKTLVYLSDFNIDSHVQVFEVSIRMLGGLLSAHIIATDEADILGMRLDASGAYNGELLRLARDLGYRLLAAFEASPNAVPYPRTNLKHGFTAGETPSTCTAGVGTLLLEFGTLSRLTNETIFEDVARMALDEMWAVRSKKNLFGNVYDLEEEHWAFPVAGISAGVDSIYEYMLKAHVYFGDPKYLDLFDAAYSALLQYSRDAPGGYAFYNVNMKTGEVASSWVDALGAFFPGLMVLAGDVDGAESAYMLYYHIWNRFRAMPERFNLYMREPDIAYYVLRPEFVESTYYLYRATRDPFYLDVGEMILTDMNALMRTSCGFTSIHNVHTYKLEERMDSFVLSETFKYLYLLFDDDHPLNRLDSRYVFTTEGHVLLPLSPVSSASKQYPSHSSFRNPRLLHSDRPPKNLKPLLLKVDNIRNRIRAVDPQDMFAFPAFPNVRAQHANDTRAHKADLPRKCPIPRALGLRLQYPDASAVGAKAAENSTAASSRLALSVGIAAELKPLGTQSPLEQLHGIQQLGRALQSSAGHSLKLRPFLLTLHASSGSATLPLRNDFYNTESLVNYPDAQAKAAPVQERLPARKGTAVVDVSLEVGLEFGAMCSVPEHLYLTQRHEVWGSALADEVDQLMDVQGTKDLPDDADTWMAPNTRQYSFTDFLFMRATKSPVLGVDTSYSPKSRRGVVPLFRDIQFEGPDRSGQMPIKAFYAQQQDQLEEEELQMCGQSTPSSTAAAAAKRRGYVPATAQQGGRQTPQQQRLVFTNGVGQVMTDYVIVRASADVSKPPVGPSSGEDALVIAGAHIVNELADNQGAAQVNGTTEQWHRMRSTSRSRGGRHPIQRRRRREYAGRLAYLSEMSLYRHSEPLLVPQPTVLTMLHLHGPSAVYGCEEYTPREKRLFAGAVIAVRAGGGCAMWQKAIHAMNAGASALLVDTVDDGSVHNCEPAEQGSPQQQQGEKCCGLGAAANASGPGQGSREHGAAGSAEHRLTDRFQHICAWRTSADDRCWPEDQYADASMSQELRRWSRLLQHRDDNDGGAEDERLDRPVSSRVPYPLPMPVVIVDRGVIGELEGFLAAGRRVQVQLL
ncbi:hypothetical protein GGF46_000762 [Coemansia sp. RSA 552]|nr:hypothetical protein GGF46_000762 [Coemansia sp. RSA 552]